MTGTETKGPLVCACGWQHPNAPFARSRMAEGQPVRCAACGKTFGVDTQAKLPLGTPPVEGGALYRAATAERLRSEAQHALEAMRLERDALRARAEKAEADRDGAAAIRVRERRLRDERDAAQKALAKAENDLADAERRAGLAESKLRGAAASGVALDVTRLAEAISKATLEAAKGVLYAATKRPSEARTLPSETPRAKLDLEPDPSPKQVALAGQAIVPDKVTPPEKKDPTPTLTDTPKAPASKPGLAKCPKCRKFILGTHNC